MQLFDTIDIIDTRHYNPALLLNTVRITFFQLDRLRLKLPVGATPSGSEPAPRKTSSLAGLENKGVDNFGRTARKAPAEVKLLHRPHETVIYAGIG